MSVLAPEDQSVHCDKYALPRNNTERERLELHEGYAKEILGGRLIIDKTVKLSRGSRVLDSGTGAASWLLDLLKGTKEDIEIVGIDISAAMFPKDVPSNARLYEMSCLDLSEDWTNSFDLINQRLLVGAFTETQWVKSLSELFRVLKPGGAVQLIEAGHMDSAHGSHLPPATKKVNDYNLTVFKKRDIVGYDIGYRLPALVEQAGFSDIQVEDHQAPLGKQWGDIGDRGREHKSTVFRAFGVTCLEHGGLGMCKSLAEVDDTVERAKQEWDENPGIFYHLYTITARKPCLRN